MRFIRKDEVPIPTHKSVTYPRFTAAYRPEKADLYRVRIRAGGDKLTDHGETATYGAGMTTIKTHLNSAVSTPGAKYCSADCSNVYLETGLPDP